MKRRYGFLLAIPALAIALTACGKETVKSVQPEGKAGNPSATSPATADLRGQTYLSTAVTENGKPRALVDDTRVSLSFTKDGRLNAQAGCNTITGNVSTADGRIDVPSSEISEMACVNQKLHDQDAWLGKLLTKKPTYTLSGHSLVVKAGTTQISLTDRKVAMPDKALAGTKWNLETVIEGEVASRDAAMEKAFVQFVKGRVTGNSGCNGFGGSAKITGDTIEFGPIMSTKMACTDEAVMETEGVVLQVLKGKVPFKIESNTLTLTGADGKQLQFSAAK